MAGTLILLALAWRLAFAIPTDQHPGLSITPAEVWPLRGLLLANLAWAAAAGAALVAGLRVAATRRRAWALVVTGTLAHSVLGLPALCGNSEFLTDNRTVLICGLVMGSALGFWLLHWLYAAHSEGREWARGAWLSALLAVAALGACLVLTRGVSHLIRLSRYPALVLLLVFWCQAAASCLASLALARLPSRPRAWSRGVLVAAGGLTLLVALADPVGLLGGTSTVKLRGLVRHHLRGIDELVELERSATSETWKVSATLLSKPRAVRRVELTAVPGTAAPRKRHQVVLFVIDALRRDHVGAYGYGTATPNLDRLAAESTLYRRAYSPAPGTGASMSSILTGLPPGVLNELSVIPLSLPAVLRRHGYATGASLTARKAQLFSYPVFREQTMEDLGLTPYPDTRRYPSALSDHRIVSGLMQRLEQGPHPRFEYVHLFSAHGPFMEEGGRENYRSAIRKADEQLGRLIDFLRERGLWEETVLVVIADHGEAIGEHGMYAHAQALYEEQVAVPLIVRVPGRAPAVVQRPITLTELPALVMDALGAEWPHDAATFSRGEGEGGEPYAVQEHVSIGHLLWRSARTSRFAYHDLLVQDREELYDLEADPGELVDVREEYPDELAFFREVMRRVEEFEAGLAEEIEAR